MSEAGRSMAQSTMAAVRPAAPESPWTLVICCFSSFDSSDFCDFLICSSLSIWRCWAALVGLPPRSVPGSLERSVVMPLSASYMSRMSSLDLRSWFTVRLTPVMVFCRVSNFPLASFSVRGALLSSSSDGACAPGFSAAEFRDEALDVRTLVVRFPVTLRALIVTSCSSSRYSVISLRSVLEKFPMISIRAGREMLSMVVNSLAIISKG
mmetsp:Transcript_11355/g.29037  ORF Transcript_11355/g.29037 Transcript_11355/m.29037 type:complete len:209 (+) Transcript_11355:384-1010(+)